MFSPAADYLLRVEGDSLKDANIFDGDLLGVHKTPEARDGQSIVARVDDDVTVKRFEKRQGQLRLLPENADYAPIVVDPRRHSRSLGNDDRNVNHGQLDNSQSSPILIFAEDAK